MQQFFLLSRYQKLASATFLCIVCCIPKNGIGDDAVNAMPSLLRQIEIGEKESLLSRFDDLECFLRKAQDPLSEGCNFLQTFLNELNAQYGRSLTISDACRLVKENLPHLQIPLEAQAPLLKVIELLESGKIPPSDLARAGKWHFNFYWPWEWNWFGLNKDEKKEKKPSTYAEVHETKETDFPGTLPPDDGIPGNVAAGACELLAGALLLILPFGVTQVVGWGLITDGSRRILDGAIQLDDERRGTSPRPNPPAFSPVSE